MLITTLDIVGTLSKTYNRGIQLGVLTTKPFSLSLKHSTTRAIPLNLDRQKSYVDKRISLHSFKVTEKVFLRVEYKRGSLHMGKWKKLALRYCGIFEILVGIVAYKLVLPLHVMIHNDFHVSFLHKYVPNHNHVLVLII